MTCEAKLPSLRNPGWTCDGSGLVVLFRVAGGSLKGIPVVAPAELLDQVLTGPAAATIAALGQFTGGDHMHLVITPRKRRRGGRLPDAPTRRHMSDAARTLDQLVEAYRRLAPISPDGTRSGTERGLADQPTEALAALLTEAIARLAAKGYP